MESFNLPVRFPPPSERKRGELEELKVEKASRNAVVAIKFKIFKRRSDSEPARCGCGFDARDASFADDDHVAAAHGPTNEDYFEFNLGFENQLARAEEENSGGADVARDQRNREIFSATVDAAQAQRKAQGSPWIFTMFGEHADCMCGDAREAAHRVDWLQRHHSKRRHANRSDGGSAEYRNTRSVNSRRGSSVERSHEWPRTERSRLSLESVRVLPHCIVRCAHLTLRDASKARQHFGPTAAELLASCELA